MSLFNKAVDAHQEQMKAVQREAEAARKRDAEQSERFREEFSRQVGLVVRPIFDDAVVDAEARKFAAKVVDESLDRQQPYIDFQFVPVEGSVGTTVAPAQWAVFRIKCDPLTRRMMEVSFIDQRPPNQTPPPAKIITQITTIGVQEAFGAFLSRSLQAHG